jgi:8-oxo-dGTP diphosphatase
VNERQSFYVGIKGIIQNKGGEVLILQATVTGKWELPGGRIDVDQSIDEAFARELSEELGATNSKLHVIIDVAQGAFSVENDHKLLLVFYRASATLPANLVLSDEHSSAQWVSKANIDNYKLYDADKRAVLTVL